MKSFSLIEVTSIHRRIEANGEPVRCAYAALAAVRDALSERAHLLLGLAHDRHPGLADDEALKRLADGWFALASEIQKAGAETRRRCKADSASLEWHVKAAGWRQLEIIGETSLAERCIRDSAATIKARRETLMQAGASTDEAARIAPDADLIELQAKIAGLEAERAQIARFFVTRDPDDLPANFEDTIQAYKIAQHVVDEPEMEGQAA